jgi:hypothetical protein
MGGCDVNDSARTFGIAVARSAADLALQPVVGLLPQRRSRTGGNRSVGISSRRQIVIPALFNGSTERMPPQFILVGASVPTFFCLPKSHRFPTVRFAGAAADLQVARQES